jgi:WD40 repeat protein
MRFNGFISYSHAADGRLAPAVQRGLHRMAKPWHRRRALWIFRDQTGLSVTPGLWSSIQDALDGSDYFVLLASPEAAGSPWVNREIEHWVASKSADQILPVVTDGEWQWDPQTGDFTEGSTAVPSALRGVFTEEPLYLDLRWARNDVQLSLEHARFRDAIAQLAAPMHGVSKDDLEGEDVRQHRRVRRVRSVAVLTLVLLTLVASMTGVLAVRNANEANASAAEARRQQQVASEQRGNAERSAQEAGRQEDLAQQNETLAANAADEAQRQQRLAREQRALATRASLDAKHEQANAKRQRVLADRATKRAQAQQRLASKESTAAKRWAQEAERQQKLAREQEKRAKEASEKARQKEQEARQQEERAKKASAEADRQQRIAISRRLTIEARTTLDDDPVTALKLGVAANRIQPDAEARRGLTEVVTSTRYAGAVSHGVTHADFGSKGTLVTNELGGNVSLWDVNDRANPIRLSTLDEYQSTITGATFSPDEQTLVAMDWDIEAHLWNVADRKKPVYVAPLPSGDWVQAVEYSPDGRTIAIGDNDGIITFWNVTDPAKPDRLSSMTVESSVDAFAFSPDGHLLVVSAGDERTVWDVTDLTDPAPVVTLDGDGFGKHSIAYHPTEPLLAVGSSDGTVTLWDMSTPAKPRREETLRGHAQFAHSVAFSSDGRLLATGDWLGTVLLWDVLLTDEALLLDRLDGRGSIGALSFSPDDRTLASTGDEAAILWNVAEHGAPRLATDLSERADTHGRVLTTTFRPGGKSLATANSDGTATFWDMTKPTEPVLTNTVPVHSVEVHSAAFSPDGRTAAAAGSNGRVQLTDVTDPARPQQLGAFTEGMEPQQLDMSRMAFSPDGRTLAVINKSDHAVLWDVTNRSAPTRLTRLGSIYSSVLAFSPDGRTLLANDFPRYTTTIWDLTNRASPTQIGQLKGSIRWLTYSQDGTTLATATDKKATLWDVTNRVSPRRLSTLTAHDTWDPSFAFSPDGKTLTTGSWDHTGILWDITERNKPIRLSMLERNWSQSISMLFSPDGKTLVASGDDDLRTSTVAIWDYTELNTLRADPAKTACAVTGNRGLTTEEWARYVPELPYQRTCGS